jgi:uncharacterized Zn-binding protein involved in type VI secretion
VSGPVFPAARKGDRISHAAAATQRSAEVLVSALVGQALAATGKGGALLAQIGAGVACASRAAVSITELIPQITNGVIEVASPTVLLAPGLGAALSQAAPVACHLHPAAPIVPAATTILIQGLALARSGGQTACGAILCDGAKTVLAGGPSSSGAGTGTQGGSPISDAIAYADKIAGRVTAAAAAVERGAELIEKTVTDTVAKAQGTVSGVVSAIAGGLAGLTRGGGLGALAGSLLASQPSGAPDAELEG